MGVAVGADKDAFLATKIAEWFKEARPIGQGLFLTDKAVCLGSVVDGDAGVQVVQMLDRQKKPLCRK